MKIIKPGKSPSERVVRGRCRSCYCEVEFKAGEANRSFTNPRDGVTTYEIGCPTKAKR